MNILLLTSSVFTPAVIGAAVALVMGIAIFIVFKLFAVKTDPRVDEINAILPGVNCGGCGYSGCIGYAEALASGADVDSTKCTAGGEDTAAELAAYLGVEAGLYIPKVAHVYCQGTQDHTKKRYEYTGTLHCASAHGLYSGPNSCTYGCLGFGDCVNVCEFNALYIENGIAHVNHENCTACGKCVDACPKHLIHMIPKHEAATVCTCSNHWPGAVTRKNCSIGCIGCTRCVKACPVDAIHMDDSLAVIDQMICIHCGECVKVCPTFAIRQGLLSGPGTTVDNSVIQKAARAKEKEKVSAKVAE